jgi:hypothetical protein
MRCSISWRVDAIAAGGAVNVLVFSVSLSFAPFVFMTGIRCPVRFSERRECLRLAAEPPDHRASCAATVIAWSARPTAQGASTRSRSSTDKEAPIVRRIYEEYLAGHGLEQIARRLNDEGIPARAAGRRGSGSWAPSAVRTILLNAQYRGLYIHGRIKKVRQGGTATRVKSDPGELVMTEIPEWRIVDDTTWFAVNERFSVRGPREVGRAPARYALTGIAR